MDALILVDLQNDFLPGGALAVREGDQVVPIANHLISKFACVVATQDWHPRNHGSFAANHPGKAVGEFISLGGLPQILWPAHAVQGTSGAAFAPGLETGKITRVFPKGTDPEIDSYSGFFDNGHRRETGLGAFLKDAGVSEVTILGLATDYCVKFTALDARSLGFTVHLVVDACRGVDLNPGDVERALADMRAAGVKLVQSSEV
jgi:nicotinamidase/pyrazinamidase